MPGSPQAGPQAELADDVVDALRALRAADVVCQRGTALRTSGGFEVCFDARTAHAVCTKRRADGDAAYVITYDDDRGAVSVAGAILDIQADVIPSFGGAPARGLPGPAHRIEDLRIQLERPDDHPPSPNARSTSQ